MKSMLYEHDVIEAVCAELRRHGYQIEQALTTKQQGIDIIASRPDSPRLFIEAKGETSSLESSKRYGQPFDSAQVHIHVAEALYTGAEILSKVGFANDVRVGIALPDNELHRRFEKAVHAAVAKLGIIVFWVRHDWAIEIQSPWGAGEQL